MTSKDAKRFANERLERFFREDSAALVGRDGSLDLKEEAKKRMAAKIGAFDVAFDNTCRTEEHDNGRAEMV
jgi:hypothetical protein